MILPVGVELPLGGLLVDVLDGGLFYSSSTVSDVFAAEDMQKESQRATQRETERDRETHTHTNTEKENINDDITNSAHMHHSSNRTAAKQSSDTGTL